MQTLKTTAWSAAKRIVAAVVAALLAAATVAVPQPASAQPLPNLSSSPASFVADLEAQARDLESQAKDAAWATRNELNAQAENLLADAQTAAAQTAVDRVMEQVFPGLIEARTAQTQPAPSFDYGSCPAEAKVCVDLDGRRTWLQNGGQVYHEAARMAPGSAGQDTPRGTFYVNRKVKDEISYEFNNAPMPYAVYFTYNGHAFHEGDPASLSAGCIRLERTDAIKYFNDLQIGDMVYIY